MLLIGYLIPFSLFLGLTIWVRTLVDVLRYEQDYFWLFLTLLLPPVGVPLYWINFRILGDERRGLTYMRRRRLALARAQELEKLILEGDMPARREELAGIYFDQKLWDEALRHLGPLLDMDEENLRAQYMTGVCLIQKEKNEAAIPHLQYVVEQQPGFQVWGAYLALAEAQEKAGRLEESLASYEDIERHISFPEATYKHACLLDKMGQSARGRQLLQELIRDYKEDHGFAQRRDRPWIEAAKRVLKQR